MSSFKKVFKEAEPLENKKRVKNGKKKKRKKKKEKERGLERWGLLGGFPFSYLIFLPQHFRPRKSWN